MAQISQNLTLLKNITLNQEIIIQQNNKIIELLANAEPRPVKENEPNGQ